MYMCKSYHLRTSEPEMDRCPGGGENTIHQKFEKKTCQEICADLYGNFLFKKKKGQFPQI